MRNGRLYARPTSAPLTGASGCSSSPLLKTPTAQLAINGGTQHPDKRKAGGHGPTLADEVEHLLPTPRARDHKGRDPNPRGVDLNEAVALLPTPTTSEGRGPGALDGPRNDTLRAQVMLLPTPRASDTGTPGRRASEGWRPPLSQVLLPTPRASDTGTPGRRASEAAEGGPPLSQVILSQSGATTPPRSTDGAASSDGQLLLPLNLDDTDAPA